MLSHDEAYDDMTHDERLLLRDRRDDHAPADWFTAFPTWAQRIDTDARAMHDEYRARRDTRPHGQGIKSMPRAA